MVNTNRPPDVNSQTCPSRSSAVWLRVQPLPPSDEPQGRLFQLTERSVAYSKWCYIWLDNLFESLKLKQYLWVLDTPMDLACVIRNFITDLYSLEVFNFATACTPTKYRCAALTSSKNFTVMNYQAVPKANQMSVPTSNMFRWPSHIFRLPYGFNQLIALLFFWFQNLQLLQVCMTQWGAL